MIWRGTSNRETAGRKLRPSELLCEEIPPAMLRSSIVGPPVTPRYRGTYFASSLHRIGPKTLRGAHHLENHFRPSRLPLASMRRYALPQASHFPSLYPSSLRHVGNRPCCSDEWHAAKTRSSSGFSRGSRDSIVSRWYWDAPAPAPSRRSPALARTEDAPPRTPPGPSAARPGC